MIKEALEYLIGLRAPTRFSYGDRDYADKLLMPVRNELPDAQRVRTLTGFIDAVTMNFDSHNAEDSFIHVEDHETVKLVSQDTDEWNRRAVHIVADFPDVQKFNYGACYEPEAFIIALQSQFTDQGDRDKLVKLCSSLTSENIATAEDDGISQTAITRKGAALKEKTTINPRVSLAPYRTFHEVAQVESAFLFRLKARDGQPPLCTLFEADGGKWSLDAAEKVREFVAGKLNAFKTVL